MKKIQTNCYSKGVSLIEVLVSVAIISFGLLSIGALQINAGKVSHDAIQRTIATQLVQEMIQRMRANASSLSTYSNGGIGKTIAGGGAALTSTDCEANLCSSEVSSTVMADYDMAQWEVAILGAAELSAASTNTGGLLSPTGCITGPNGGSGIYTITLVWRGAQSINNTNANTCGTAGLYGASNEFRRIISVSSYISTAGIGV